MSRQICTNEFFVVFYMTEQIFSIYILDRASVYIRMMNMFIDTKKWSIFLYSDSECVDYVCSLQKCVCFGWKAFIFCIFRVLYKRIREIDYLFWLPISYFDRILSNNIIVDSKNSHNKSIYMKQQYIASKSRKKNLIFRVYGYEIPVPSSILLELDDDLSTWWRFLFSSIFIFVLSIFAIFFQCSEFNSICFTFIE